MSNPDSFIDEVTEEVRRDRLFGLWRRYGWIAVAVVVAVVGTAAALEWQNARARAVAQALGDAMLAALAAPDSEARAAALAEIGADGPAAAIVDFLRASELQGAGETDAALAILSRIADDNALPQEYRQLAMLKRAIVGAGTLPLDARRAQMEQLAAPGQPFRPLALEQLALIAVEAGDTAAAIAQFRTLLDEADATPALRERASQAIVALGGNVRES